MKTLKMMTMAIVAMLFALSAFAQETPQSPVDAYAAQLAAEGEILAGEAARLEGVASRINKMAYNKRILAQVLAEVVGEWECFDIGDDNKSEGVVSRDIFVFDGYYEVQRSGRAVSYITAEQKHEFGGEDYLFEASATVSWSYSAERQDWNVTESDHGIHLFTGDGERWEITGKPEGTVLIKKNPWYGIVYRPEAEQPSASLKREGEGFLATVLNETQRFPEPNSRPAIHLWEEWKRDCKKPDEK